MILDTKWLHQKLSINNKSLKVFIFVVTIAFNMAHNLEESAL